MLLLCKYAGQSKVISSAALKPTTIAARWAARNAFGAVYPVDVIVVFSHDTHVFRVTEKDTVHKVIVGKKGAQK